MDRQDRLRVFLAVAGRQSFSKAAQDLGLTGPALSKQIQKLEAGLGIALFHRTTRQVRLSEAGYLYQKQVQKTLDELSEVERNLTELSKSPRGLLRISVPISFGKAYLREPLAAFAMDYPDLRLEVDFDDRRVDVIAEAYDLVVRIGALRDTSLKARRLISCPIGAYASPEFVARYGMPSSPHDLDGLPAVVFSRHGIMQDWRYVGPKGARGVIGLQRAFSTNMAEMMTSITMAGLGYTILPIFAVWDLVAEQRLIPLLPGYESDPKAAVHALFPEERASSLKLRLLLDRLIAVSRKFPWANI